MSSTTPKPFDARYTFPVDTHFGAAPAPGSNPSPHDDAGDSFPVIQPRAGHIAGRPYALSNAGSSSASPSRTHTPQLRAIDKNSLGGSPGKSPVALAVSGGSGPMSRRVSDQQPNPPRLTPPSRNVIAYVHGDPALCEQCPGTEEGNSINATAPPRGDRRMSAVVSLGDGGSDAAAAAEFRQNSLPFSSILQHTRARLSGVASAIGGSRSGTPQLMYRQDTIEEVTRTSPVASAANSRAATPCTRSHAGSLFLLAGGGVDFGGSSCCSSVPGGGSAVPSGGGARIGVSTPAMAEYYADPTALHSSATYSSEKTVNNTLVMQKCLRSLQEQSALLLEMQAEMRAVLAQNRRLEERVRRLEHGYVSSNSGTNNSTSNANNHPPIPTNEEETDGDEATTHFSAGSASEGTGRTSGSPSAPRPSDTMPDDYCSTRGPSKAV